MGRRLDKLEKRWGMFSVFQSRFLFFVLFLFSLVWKVGWIKLWLNEVERRLDKLEKKMRNVFSFGYLCVCNSKSVWRKNNVRRDLMVDFCFIQDRKCWRVFFFFLIYFLFRKIDGLNKVGRLDEIVRYSIV